MMNPAALPPLVICLAAGLLLTVALTAAAAPPAAERAGVRAPARTEPAADAGMPWKSLQPSERKALAPLERDWANLSESQKLKWVELSQRLPSMSTDQQQRIQARMAEWARMTPAERGQARLNFMQSQRTGAEDREKRWGDYQALPSEQKKQFAARAAAPASTPAGSKTRPSKEGAADRGNSTGITTKSNLVPNPNFSAQPRTIAPTMLKAGPGASTTAVSKNPTPPSHQQTGLPKITASPGFVDRDTLLPKRGPQGAAARPVDGESGGASPVPRP